MKSTKAKDRSQERASLSLSLSTGRATSLCYRCILLEGSASQVVVVVVSQDRPALNTSYVLVSKFAVLPRGACSRRRAVPDWTSLGPWSREGRSRFTSASRRPPSTWTLPALLPLYLSLSLSLFSSALSLSLSPRPAGFVRVKPRTCSTEALPVSPASPFYPRPHRGISGPTAE